MPRKTDTPLTQVYVINMKIITQPIDTWSYNFICNECGAELEAEAGDLVHTHYEGDQRDPAYDTWSLTCPVCSHSTILRDDKIPKIVKINHRKRQSYGGPFER